MSDPRLPDYLDHIRRAATGAQQYLEGMELSEFLEDEFVQDAVMMKFIVMGEAATRILNRYPDVAENHPEIPWRQMRGMRNRMAHGYFDIDYETVWVTAQEFLTDVLRDQNQTAPQEWTDHDRTKHCGRLNGQNAATHRSAAPPPQADTVCLSASAATIPVESHPGVSFPVHIPTVANAHHEDTQHAVLDMNDAASNA